MGNENSGARIVSVSREIAAPPDVIFELLATPSEHARIDGEETVKGARDSSPERLSLGATFGMDMKLGVPYIMKNEVVEFVENERIAWRHFGHHVWRYELAPIDTGTLVTESFDWSVARFPPFYEWVKYPARHEVGMAKTLEKLADVVENR